MTMHVIESSLSLLVGLGLYKLSLENQPLHHLKRAYLLGTLLVSLMAPLITVEVPMGTLPVIESMSSQVINRQYVGLPIRSESIPANVPEPVNYWLGFYAVGTLLMLIRFGRNGYRLVRQLTDNPTAPFRGATLVQLPGDGLPYTFLNYLFVPDDAYKRGEIEGELFIHELAHIRQRHSLDVLLVELVLCFGWWNPLLFWLKRAIQLNHEFLADAAVNAAFGNVPSYQTLLLSKLTPHLPRLSLTSTLTFQTTKQRLTMMTKHASPLRTWLAATGSALLLGTLTVLLSTRTVAQQTDAFTPKTTVPKPVKRLPQPSVAEMEQQFGRVQVRFTCREDGMKTRQKKFADLTPEQKGRVILIQPMPPTAISEVELQALKNPKKYGIWVDGKRDRNFTNNRTLKASDIIAYNSSFVHKNARQPAGYSYQVDLLTDTAYSAYVKQMQDRPTLILVTKERLEQWQKAHPVR